MLARVNTGNSIRPYSLRHVERFGRRRPSQAAPAAFIRSRKLRAWAGAETATSAAARPAAIARPSGRYRWLLPARAARQSSGLSPPDLILAHCDTVDRLGIAMLPSCSIDPPRSRNRKPRAVNAAPNLSYCCQPQPGVDQVRSPRQRPKTACSATAHTADHWRRGAWRRRRFARACATRATGPRAPNAECAPPGARRQDPARQNGRTAILGFRSVAAVDALRHRHEIIADQLGCGDESARADPGRRRRCPVLAATPQHFQNQREPERLTARLAKRGTQQAIGALLADPACRGQSSRSCRAPQPLAASGSASVDRPAGDRARAAGRAHGSPIPCVGSDVPDETASARATAREDAQAARHLPRATSGRAYRAGSRHRPRPPGQER